MDCAGEGHGSNPVSKVFRAQWIQVHGLFWIQIAHAFQLSVLQHEVAMSQACDGAG